MLSKKRRIPRVEFTKILKEGKRHNSPNLLLYSLSTRENTLSKFSFSVSKKVYKNAVDRNKYRRRGYAVINNHLKQIKIGYLCFFSFKKILNKLTFKVLEEQILHLLTLSGVLI